MPSFQTSIVVVSILLPLLAIAAVALRLYAQSGNRSRLGADDIAILVCLAIVIGIGILTIYGAYHGGFGSSLAEMDPPTQMMFAKLLFAHQFFWLSSVAVVKLSLLLFYRRVFSIAKFRIVMNIMIALVIMWWITFIFGTLFSTTPISAQWTNVGTYNLDYPSFLIASCTTDMVIDVAVLCLPLTVIRTLQISTKKKFYLAGIFGLGLFCTVASMVRLAYIVQLAQFFGTAAAVFSYTTTDIILWSVIEPCISTITACLPLLGPLVKSAANSGVVSHMRSYLGRRDVSRKGTPGYSGNSDTHPLGNSMHERRAWQPISANGIETNISGGDQHYEMNSVKSKPKAQGIHVQHTTTQIQDAEV